MFKKLMVTGILITGISGSALKNKQWMTILN